MKTKELISSYDETNDIFVGKISYKSGYTSNYDISNGIFLNVDKNNLPVSVYIDEASDVLNVNKKCLENPNVSISLMTTDKNLYFKFFIANKMIYESKSENVFNIPEISYEIKAN